MRSFRLVSRVFPASLMLAFLGACEGNVSSQARPSGAAGAGGAGEAGTAGAAGRPGAGGMTTGAAGDGGSAGAEPAGAAGTIGADGAAGASDATAAGGASGSSRFPARFAAPYVETWNNVSLTDLATATGNKFYTLAFVIGGNGCTPTWNGGNKLVATDTYWGNQISNLRKAGGDVLVSFGGASGTELGDACKTVETAQAAYQAVITKYGLTWIDLDIESGAEKNTVDVDRRNKALKNLQAVNPGLKISYTLAVNPTGLPSADRNLLANAKSNGVQVDTVNIMAMDYGSCNIDMGKTAIMAAMATQGQIQTLGTTSLVGVTPMIGVNDTACENFTTANAMALVSFAQDNAFINLLAFWAIGADRNHSYLEIFKALH